jgi:archaellum component FlaC
MSSSDETVLQKKDGETMLPWRKYEALRDHLKRAINHSIDTLDGDIDAVKTQLGHIDNTVNTIQTQVTDIWASMARLEATVTRLTGMYAQDNQPYGDADSIGDNEEVFNEAN